MKQISSEKGPATSEDESTQAGPTRISHWRLIIDHARVTPEVRSYAYEGHGTDESPFIVTWIDNDSGNPLTWSMSRKWTITMAAAISTLAVAFASTAFSGSIVQLETELHASVQLVSAGISLFVLGFAFGPLCWAPLSEQYGRQIVFVVTFFLFTVFNAGCAGANNIATLLVLRFFSAALGSSPLTNSGGIIADMFPAAERGLAMNVFAIAPALGPCLGPFIGGFLGTSAGWRWMMGFVTIFSGALWVIQSLAAPETYPVVLLRKRAAALSKMTGKVYMTKSDIQRGPITMRDIILTTLTRPWILLFREPIVLLLSTYMAIVYGTLYMLFGAFPIVYQQNRGWSEGVGGLAFLGVAVGMLAAIAISPVFNKMYMTQVHKHDGIAPPEARLVPGMIGALAVPVGMFWFAWTNAPSIPWISSVAAGAPFGFGFCLIFLAIQMYLIDAYSIFSASVLAATTVLRSLFGAAFPLFTADMYENLGIHWASSIPAFLALIFAPFPFVLAKYGEAIRQRCVYAAEAAAAMDDMRARVEDDDDDAEDEGQDTLSSAVTRDSDISGDSPSRSEKRASHDIARTLATHERLSRVSSRKSRTGSIIESARYEGNPYDIDFENTSTSVGGLKLSRTRTNASAAGR